MIEDLFWILRSPSLMRVTDTAVTSGTDWITEIASECNLNVDLPVLARERLGTYYENLVNLIIKRSEQPIEVYRNIQVRNNKRTLGEFDFLGHTVDYDFHLECAIKFYLCTGDGSELSHFIGPGKRDRLDIKFQHMLKHQLTLSDTPEGLTQCEDLNISPSKKIILLQGYLFYHLLQHVDSSKLHPDINPEHLVGWWVRQGEIAELSDQFIYGWLEKPYWLFPKPKKVETFSELKASIETCQRPILVCRLDKEAGMEIDRGFIVPDDW